MSKISPEFEAAIHAMTDEQRAHYAERLSKTLDEQRARITTPQPSQASPTFTPPSYRQSPYHGALPENPNDCDINVFNSLSRDDRMAYTEAWFAKSGTKNWMIGPGRRKV